MKPKLPGLGAVLAVSLIMFSCAGPFADKTAGSGLLSLTLSGVASSGGRTIVPGSSDLAMASYAITLSRADFADRTVTLTHPTLTSDIAGLEPGDWAIAASGASSGGLTIATGSASVTIAATGSTAATVSLAYTVADATNTGSIAITLVFPHSVGITSGASGVETTLDGAAISPALTVASIDSSDDKVTYAASGIGSASPLLRIALKRDGVVLLSWAERVWVYKNVTTTKVDTIGAASFGASPPAPASLSAALQADGSALLSWPNVGMADSYKLERSADGGASYSTIAGESTLTAGTTGYTDSSLVIAEAGYRYRISSANTFGASAATVNAADLAVTPTFIVAYDRAALAIGYQSGDSATTVTQDVILATTASAGTTISWSSTNTAIATDGKVTRPAFSVGDRSGNLQATISNNGASATKAFTGLVVLKVPQTEAEAVADGTSTLAITYGGSDTISTVTQNMVLPTSGSSATAVSWASGNGAYISSSGGVTQPAQGVGNQTVTLTATISKGTTSATRDFGPITVLQIAAGYYIAGDGSGGGGAGDYFTDYNRNASGGSGGGGSDTIAGTAGNDVIFGDGSGGGGGGTPYRISYGGAGGSGADSLNGGGGNDILFGDGFYGMNGLRNADGVAGGFGGGGGGGGYLDTGYGGNGGLLAGGGGGPISPGVSLYGGYSGGAASKPSGGTTNQTDNSWGGNSAYPSSGYGQSLGGTCYNSFGAGGGAGFGGLNDQAQGINATGGSTYGNGGVPQGGDGIAGTTTEVRWYDSSVGLYNYVYSQLPYIFTTTPGSTKGTGSGNDIINGGAGSDELFGMGGNNSFVFELNEAGPSDTDRVWDFRRQGGTDLLRLTIGGTLISTAVRDALIAAQTTPSGTDRQIVFSGTGKRVTIVIKNLGRNLESGDFP